tara:strand:+ start:9523 stop:9789 length:267 start_codon:yes stop_codon:yes gene_type:complete
MSIFGKKTRGIPQNATFRLTQEGREKLQEFSGDPKSQILVALETRGSSDIDEISNASGLSRGQVERFIPALTKGGYIQYISSTSEGLE